MRRRSGISAPRGHRIENLAENAATASTTSVCLKFSDPRIKDGAAFAKAVAKPAGKEGVGLDLGAYRDAPAGLRIWCGSTIETADVQALRTWIREWAFDAEIAAPGVSTGRGLRPGRDILPK